MRCHWVIGERLQEWPADGCLRHLHRLIQSDRDATSRSKRLRLRWYLSWAWAPAAVEMTFQLPHCLPSWICYVWGRPAGSRTRWLSQWTLWPLRRVPPGCLGKRGRTGRSRLHPAQARHSLAADRTEEDQECLHQAKQIWNREEWQSEIFFQVKKISTCQLIWSLTENDIQEEGKVIKHKGRQVWIQESLIFFFTGYFLKSLTFYSPLQRLHMGWRCMLHNHLGQTLLLPLLSLCPLFLPSPPSHPGPSFPDWATVWCAAPRVVSG